MGFIQLIDYETDRAAEIDRAMRTQMAQDMGDMSDMGFVRLEQTQDHDNPRHYVTIVEFASYEAAMKNSGRPQTDMMAKQLADLCTSGPHYQNLDVQLAMP
jgi:hypothetical protein